MSFLEYDLVAVFLVVLVQQLGAPIPALPVLLFAGAKGIDDPMYAVYALALSVAACTAGNLAWFWAGRRYGHRVLRLLCRVALSPDSCVRQTENAFERRGTATLVIAKFVPGLATVAPPLAGALRLRLLSFLVYNTAGSALWAGTGLILGLVFHGQVEWLLDWLLALGGLALPIVTAALALYVAYRWRVRWRMLKSLTAARISAAELHAMMSQGGDPVVLDVRSLTHRRLDGRRIPGARPVDLDDLERALAGVSRNQEVVVYCACPNEATAVKVSLRLMNAGFRRVRPLAGGVDAWVSAGLAVEQASADEAEKAG